MTERPKNAEDAPRNEAEALLPWYHSGRLSDAERSLVDEALEQDPALRDELDRLDIVQATVQASSDAVAAPPAGDFDRLMSQIEADERTAAIVRDEKRSSLFGWLGNLGAAFAPPAVRVALSVAVVAIAVQSAVIVGMGGEEGNGENSFQTASKEPGAAQSDATRVLVIFQPEATAGAITALLSEVGGSIVEGPSQEGAFVLTLGSTLDETAVQATLAELTARADLVVFAGPAP